MGLSKNISVLISAGVLIFFSADNVFADRCDEIFEGGSKSYAQAGEALKRKDYARAIKLYEEAEGLYAQVADMKDCRSPKIVGSALTNVQLCQSNVAKHREHLAWLNYHKQEKEDFEVYNQGVAEYSQGNEYAQAKQWDAAIKAYESAAWTWGVIASNETKNGKKAAEALEDARNALDRVQKLKEQ